MSNNLESFSISIKPRVNQRLNQLDIMKGIGIICAVMDHAGIPNYLFYSFEVSLFFYIAGFCFNVELCTSLKGILVYIHNQIKRLYIPFIMWNTMFILLNNLFMQMGIYTDNPAFLQSDFVESQYGLDSYLSFSQMIKQIVRVLLLMDTAKIGGMSWFIRALFVVTVGYAISSYIINRIGIRKHIVLIQTLLSYVGIIGILVIGIMNSVPYIITSFVEYYMMFSIGQIIRERKGYLNFNIVKVFLGVLIVTVNAYIQYRTNYVVSMIQVTSYLLSSFATFYLSYNVAVFLDNHTDRIQKIRGVIICRVTYNANHIYAVFVI